MICLNFELVALQEGELTVAIDDVRLCTTRLTDDSDRKNCFEIISVDKSFTLQAENEHVRDLWMDAIRVSWLLASGC